MNDKPNPRPPREMVVTPTAIGVQGATLRAVYTLTRTVDSAIDPLADEVLMERIAASGDMEAFGVLYDRHMRFVLNKTWGMVRAKDQAEDLTHDIFMKLFSNAGKYSKGSFMAWLSVLAYNVVIDELRKQRKWQTVEVNEDLLADDPEDDAAASIEEKELLELRVDELTELLDGLDQQERGILLMKYQDEISVKEIAAILDIGESAVKMRLKRAREHVLQLHGTQDHGR